MGPTSELIWNWKKLSARDIINVTAHACVPIKCMCDEINFNAKSVQWFGNSEALHLISTNKEHTYKGIYLNI